MADQEADELVVCPYNTAHVFKSSRLIYHINSCKDGKKNSHLFGRCKYNFLHIFRKDVLERHESHCPDSTKRKEAIKNLKELIKREES